MNLAFSTQTTSIDSFSKGRTSDGLTDGQTRGANCYRSSVCRENCGYFLQDGAGLVVRCQHSAAFRPGARSGDADTNWMSDGDRCYRLPRLAANEITSHSIRRRHADSRIRLGLLAYFLRRSLYTAAIQISYVRLKLLKIL